MSNTNEQFEDVRVAVRHLCSQFPDEYFRKIDEQRTYPAAFVDALMAPAGCQP
jgi:acyl-CoA dehydrogenase